MSYNKESRASNEGNAASQRTNLDKGKDTKMRTNSMSKFNGLSISITDNEIYLSRTDIAKVYGVPKRTLSDNIKQLKSDSLIEGAKIRPNSKGRKIEVFSSDEVVSIGLRLRSEIAIQFQLWARGIIKNALKEANEKLKVQQVQLDRLWDKSDHKDLYRR